MSKYKGEQTGKLFLAPGQDSYRKELYFCVTLGYLSLSLQLVLFVIKQLDVLILDSHTLCIVFIYSIYFVILYVW